MTDASRPGLSVEEFQMGRISYLADVRNRAMAPLFGSGNHTKGEDWGRFDKVVFLNDVQWRVSVITIWSVFNAISSAD